MSDEPHLLNGHSLVYLVMAGDLVVYSDLVPAKYIVNFTEPLDIPVEARIVEVTIMLFGVGGEPISVERRVLHPSTVRAAVNTIPWKMLENYLATVLKYQRVEPS